MTSSVTEGRNAYGSFRLDWRRDCPASIRQAASARMFPFSAIRFYGARVPAEAVGAVPGLFTGLVMRGAYDWVGGPGPTWLAGAPGGSIWETANGSGPFFSGGPIARDGSSSGTVADWVASMLYYTAAGITTGTIGGPANMNGGSLAYHTLRTMLDTFIAPAFGVEWRITDRFELDAGYTAELYPTPAVLPLAVKQGRRSPGVDSLQTVDLGLETDYSGYITRSVVRGGFGVIYEAGSTTFTTPGGGTLNWGTFNEDLALGTDPGQAKANLGFAHSGRTSTVDISVTEDQLTARVPCGGWVGVWDLDAGFWDLNNTAQYAGSEIHPVMLRVEAVDWPVVEGVGVWLDRRHIASVPAGEQLIDLTPYVEMQSGDPATRLTVGAPPPSIGRRR